MCAPCPKAICGPPSDCAGGLPLSEPDHGSLHRWSPVAAHSETASGRKISAALAEECRPRSTFRPDTSQFSRFRRPGFPSARWEYRRWGFAPPSCGYPIGSSQRRSLPLSRRGNSATSFVPLQTPRPQQCFRHPVSRRNRVLRPRRIVRHSRMPQRSYRLPAWRSDPIALHPRRGC